MTYIRFSDNGSGYYDFWWYYDCHFSWAETVAHVCFYPITHHWLLLNHICWKKNPKRWLMIFSCHLLDRFQKQDKRESTFEIHKGLYQCDVLLLVWLLLLISLDCWGSKRRSRCKRTLPSNKNYSIYLKWNLLWTSPGCI